MNPPLEFHAGCGGGAVRSTKEETLPTSDLQPIRPLRNQKDEMIEVFDLLKELDKELRKYVRRVRKGYGKHFPELATIVQNDILYAKAVKLIGRRPNAANLDFSEILPVKVETQLKELVMTSRGSKVSEPYLSKIYDWCDQVLSLSENMAEHYDELKSRMNTIAPNLTALVGEDLGARLIARAGGLLNLAKLPSSTVQILGLINRSSLIGEALTEHKGPAARSLSAKISLAVRCDAFGDKQDNSFGLAYRLKLQERLSNLQGKPSAIAAADAVTEKKKERGVSEMVAQEKIKHAEPEEDEKLMERVKNLSLTQSLGI